MAANGHRCEDAESWRRQAQGLAAENAVLRARVAELEGQVAALSEKVATLTKLLFGDSSEKKGPGGSAAGDTAGAGGGGQSGRRRGQQPGSRGHGRRDYSNLETEEEVHDVPVGQRVCPGCGAAYEPFGEERCEQIDWRVRLVRVVHRRRTYRRTCRCAVRGVLVARPVPKAIPKGMFTGGFMARLLVEKYVLGRPISRIVAALGNEGLQVAEGTLVGVLKALSALLAPLDGAIRARNAAAGHLHVDETSWKVFQTVADKANHRWWLWVFAGADSTVFSIERSRSTRVLTEHLGIDPGAGSLPGGRRLLVSSDFFTVYQALGTVDGVDPPWCWAHIRRYFIRAGDAHRSPGGWTRQWLERIGALYAGHRAVGAAEPGGAEHALAEEGFAAALDAIDLARRTRATDPGLHPAAGKVLATLDREWAGLARHQQFPGLPLDNNTAERALRNPVVGRKNYYGSGSVWASELAGRVWTATATAARAGANPLTYLTGYLQACAEAAGKPPEGTDLARFLPWGAQAGDLAARAGPPGRPAPGRPAPGGPAP